MSATAAPLQSTGTKKGVSGNPKGRPRRKPQSDGKDPVNFAAQKANQYFMEEAYRMVTLREGDQTIKLPAIQAVSGAMGVAAMKGNRHAQRMMAELVQQVENDDRELRAEHLKTMMEYKCTWEQAIEEAKARGLRVPDPIPHPDDIVIDFIKAKAWDRGPMTKEDKADFDRLLEKRDCQQLLVSKTAAGHAEATSGAKQGWLDDWKLAAFV